MTAFIFNQYYIDFLKRIKEVAKTKKETCEVSKEYLKSIKENYQTLDKSSEEYIDFLNSSITEEIWSKYLDEDIDWIEENKEICIFKNVPLKNIIAILEDNFLCHHFICVFYIFRKELTEEEATKIVNLLQTPNSKDLMEEIQSEDIKKVLTKLNNLRNEKLKEKSGIDMKFIEDTSLGKLAKEILEDIDVGKLQKSLGENGDVLKAIGDPDSGFADVIANVSRKMATKISNGDLKQENLIQDAMKFASVMPNLFGGPASGSKKQPDMSNIINMMSSMMGGGGNDDFSKMFSQMGGATASKGSKPKGTKPVFNEGALRKIAKAKKLKKKLRERKSQSTEDADSSE